MKVKINCSKKITIEGNTDASEHGFFREIYARFGRNSRISLSQFGLHENGTFFMCAFFPNVTSKEIASFQTAPVLFYRNPLPDGLITTSVRGALSMDIIRLNIPEIPVKTALKGNNIVEMFLIDSVTDEIKGYRMIRIPADVTNRIIEDWALMEQYGVDMDMATDSVRRYVAPYSFEEFIKCSQYLGRECADLTPPYVFFF